MPHARSLLRAAALAIAAALTATAAQAHVTADPGEAPAGGSPVVRFRVGHGCAEGMPTTALRIELPPGVSARPQAKAGWTIQVEHAADDPKRVTAISWTGGVLPGDEFDDFAVLVRLPATAWTLYFPAVQTCGAEDDQWTEVPDAGEDPHSLSHPAPALHLSPADHH